VPLKNTLNISELLKRIGVVGDSLGSADILDQLRLTLNIADLSDLVPPVGVAKAQATNFLDADVGERAGANLLCRSPGGLFVETVGIGTGTTSMRLWITDVQPFAVAKALGDVRANFTFGQTIEAIWTLYESEVRVAPGASASCAQGFNYVGGLIPAKIWVGPGQFFNIEVNADNTDVVISVSWSELPAMINP